MRTWFPTCISLLHCTYAVVLYATIIVDMESRMQFCLFAYEGHACVGKGEPSRVGDGGASWRLKALARAKQQASDASNPNFGRRVGDIVSEQWGSLAELTAGLTNSRAAHGALLATICVRVLGFDQLISHLKYPCTYQSIACASS